MDFQPFDEKSDDGAEMVVTHPGTGDPTDAVIVLAGSDSRAWRQANHKLSNRLLRGAADGAHIARAFDEREGNTAELLAAVTLRWRNVEDKGKKLQCTPSNAKQLYVNYPWLREQVDRFVGNRANFFRAVAANAAEGDEGKDQPAVAAEG